MLKLSAIVKIYITLNISAFIEYACEQGLLHCANIWIKTWEDYSPFASVLQYTGEDNVQELVHVKVGGEFSIPGAILFRETNTTRVLFFPVTLRSNQRTHHFRQYKPWTEKSTSAQCWIPRDLEQPGISGTWYRMR